MTIPLHPPTPTLIEGFTLEELFRNPLIIELTNDIRMALYFLINPDITTIQNVSNWNVLNNRLSLIVKEGKELRRDKIKPNTLRMNDEDKKELQHQLNRLQIDRL